MSNHQRQPRLFFLWILFILLLAAAVVILANQPVSADSIVGTVTTRDPNGGGNSDPTRDPTGGDGDPTRDPNGGGGDPLPTATPNIPPGGKDCSNTSTGLVPLLDLSQGTYQGFPGGLYGGSNNIPNTHYQIGLNASQEIEPLNTQGIPDANGKVVFLSVGMSNAKREFGAFVEVARPYTGRELAIVNGAQGNYDAVEVANPNTDYWLKIDQDLAGRDLSPEQVQVIWVKQAVANEDGSFPQHAQELKGYLRQIVLIAENRYPNLKMIYFSSRIYGGYASPSSPSPEPWAYEGGFAVQWLINSQIKGIDHQLAYSNTPWLAWGPYLWADGLEPRSDGLIWICDDFEEDGTHPADSASLKVANMLLDFFSTHPTTSGWFNG